MTFSQWNVGSGHKQYGRMQRVDAATTICHVSTNVFILKEARRHSAIDRGIEEEAEDHLSRLKHDHFDEKAEHADDDAHEDMSLENKEMAEVRRRSL